MTATPGAAGAAYMHGRYMPRAEAAIPVTDMAYRRSDVTYDVVGVWGGAFFRLDDHLRRFRKSMAALRLDPRLSDDEIGAIAPACGPRTGFREADVGQDSLPGTLQPELPRPHLK